MNFWNGIVNCDFEYAWRFKWTFQLKNFLYGLNIWCMLEKKTWIPNFVLQKLKSINNYELLNDYIWTLFSKDPISIIFCRVGDFS